jgi:hypothetical protein
VPWTQQTANISLTANLSLAVTAGDLVAIALIDQVANSTATLGDGVNSYLPIKTVSDVGNSVTIRSWYFVAATTTTLTIVATGASGQYQISAGSFRNGTLSSPAHANNGQVTIGTGISSLTYACTAGDLQVGWVTDTSAIPAANWATAGAGFTRLAAATQQDGSNPASAMEYNLNSAGGSLDSPWTGADTNSCIAIGASFTPSAGGGGGAVLFAQAIY